VSGFVEIGIIGRPHGVKGEIRVNYYADSLDLLRGALFLRAGKEPPRPVRIRTLRVHQGQPVISLDGVDDRSAAEVLRGQSLLVPESAMPPLEDDEAYLYELIGFSVLDDATGKCLGSLGYIMSHTAPETWAVITPEGREFYFPAVPRFIASIDMKARLIRIAPPAGLLELYGVYV